MPGAGKPALAAAYVTLLDGIAARVFEDISLPDPDLSLNPNRFLGVACDVEVMQQALSAKDKMMEYLEHTGSGLFVVPPG